MKEILNHYQTEFLSSLVAFVILHMTPFISIQANRPYHAHLRKDNTALIAYPNNLFLQSAVSLLGWKTSNKSA